MTPVIRSALWLGFLGLILAAWVMMYGEVIDMLGIAKSRCFAAALLLPVGLFQFTRAKEVCHGVCHSPMMYFIGHWRAGFAGNLRMGLATLFMVLEKLPQIGHKVTKPLDVLLILGACVVAGWPLYSGG